MFEDNAGAAFLSSNRQVIKITKHAYLKHHFIRKFIEDRDRYKKGETFKIESEFATSDISTKNTDIGTFKHHTAELDEGMPLLREMIYGKMELFHRYFLIRFQMDHLMWKSQLK